MTLDQIVLCHKSTMRSKLREKVSDARLARATQHALKGTDFEEALKPMERWVNSGSAAPEEGKNDLKAFAARIGKGF